ncbi:Arm DNA-binding domain-containing protein [Thermithiobacillus plumbiphilus]|uniref:DUF3596 domain-containing protein n=1 Tax=Thermithiobacillus plumbiphilus TaxID=1729899 RepID=A0ABU9D8U3_9PROT
MGGISSGGVRYPKDSQSSVEIDFYYRGVRCRERLKMPQTKANLAHCLRMLAAIEHEIALGTFSYAKWFPTSKRARIFGGVAAAAASKTVGDLLDEFLASSQRTCAASTHRDYRSAVEYHLRPAFGAQLARDLTSGEIKAWIGGLVCGNKRTNNILVPLRGALANAHQDGLIDKNPCALIKNLRADQEDPDPFRPDEQAAILAHLPDQARHLIQFAFWSGLRTSELIALEWQDVDFRRGVVLVRRASVRKVEKATKTRAGRREVRILPPAREALEAQKPHTLLLAGKVFFNPRTNLPWETDAQIRKTAWQHALRKAGVRYRYPYQTRHTYASMMLSAGENPMWVAAQMGHADWGMIRKRYGRWLPDANPEAGLLAARMFAAPRSGFGQDFSADEGKAV